MAQPRERASPVQRAYPPRCDLRISNGGEIETGEAIRAQMVCLIWNGATWNTRQTEEAVRCVCCSEAKVFLSGSRVRRKATRARACRPTRRAMPMRYLRRQTVSHFLPAVS